MQVGFFAIGIGPSADPELLGLAARAVEQCAFHSLWTGEHVVLGSPPKAPKLKALAADPRVALTIDDNQWPYNVLLVRGRASVEMLDDLGPEYELSATRYFGRAQHPPVQGERGISGRNGSWEGRNSIT